MSTATTTRAATTNAIEKLTAAQVAERLAAMRETWQLLERFADAHIGLQEKCARIGCGKSSLSIYRSLVRVASGKPASPYTSRAAMPDETWEEITIRMMEALRSTGRRYDNHPMPILGRAVVLRADGVWP